MYLVLLSHRCQNRQTSETGFLPVLYCHAYVTWCAPIQHLASTGGGNPRILCGGINESVGIRNRAPWFFFFFSSLVCSWNKCSVKRAVKSQGMPKMCLFSVSRMNFPDKTKVGGIFRSLCSPQTLSRTMCNAEHMVEWVGCLYSSYRQVVSGSIRALGFRVALSHPWHLCTLNLRKRRLSMHELCKSTRKLVFIKKGKETGRKSCFSI